MALEDMLLTLESFYGLISSALNAIVIALAILFSGFIVGRIIDRLLHKLLLRTNFDDLCYKLFGRRRRYALATRRTIVRLVYLGAIIIALDRLHLDRPALVFAVMVLVVMILASLFLAGVEVIPNLLARWRLHKSRIEIGDAVEIRDPSGIIKGKLTDVSLFEVHIKRRNGDVLFIPLAAFVRNTIKQKKS